MKFLHKQTQTDKQPFLFRREQHDTETERENAERIHIRCPPVQLRASAWYPELVELFGKQQRELLKHALARQMMPVD